MSYQVLSIFYSLWFHPLASFPGPLLARCTRIWYVYHLLKGRLPFAVQKVHEKYGPAVRLAPDELSFVGGDAWKSIYGYKHGTAGEMPKDPQMYLNTSAGGLSIFGAPSERHGTLRRLLSHGFSEKALRSQEPIIQHYLDLFIRRLRDLGAKGKKVDIVTWYNVSIYVQRIIHGSVTEFPSSSPSMLSVTWPLPSRLDVLKIQNIIRG